MKTTLIILALVGAAGLAVKAQKNRVTTSAVVTLETSGVKPGKRPMAENRTVVAVLNPKNGDMSFEIVIKSFSFLNPQMQEQFNGPEWLDSDHYPKALFQGTITNFSDINLGVDSVYSATVKRQTDHCAAYSAAIGSGNTNGEG